MMNNVCVFLAEGFEECEALLVVDLLRRAKVEVTTASITSERTVRSSHGVPVVADALASELDLSGFALLMLPGGIPGTPNLRACPMVCDAMVAQAKAGKRICAICAAPSVLGSLGLLEGKRATVYPGFEAEMTGAEISTEPVVTDGLVTTGKGLGAAIPFGLELVKLLVDEETALRIGKAIQYLN